MTASILSSNPGFNPEYAEQAPTPTELKRSAGAVLLEFGAPWCGHCLAAEPMVRAALTAYPELVHIRIYDGKGKRLGRALGIKLWPTLIVLRDGEELARRVRPQNLEQIHQLLAVLNL